MQSTDYRAIVERDHPIQSSISPEKLILLADYCDVRDGLRLLDVGCGQGWLPRTWAHRWALTATGLEVNPHFVVAARGLASAEGVAGRVTFVEGPPVAFQPESGRYDVVTCIGTSYPLGAFDQAVGWMRRALRPDGVLAVGEWFFKDPSEQAHVLSREGLAPRAYRSLAGIAAALEAQGLVVTGLIVASTDDRDQYVSLCWRAAAAWAAQDPNHPDCAAVLETITRARERYLRWERQYLGWAIFAARQRRSGW